MFNRVLNKSPSTYRKPAEQRPKTFFKNTKVLMFLQSRSNHLADINILSLILAKISSSK